MAKLIGTAAALGSENAAVAGQIGISGFNATASGALEEIKMRTGTVANTATSVVLGIYADNAGKPGTLLGQGTFASKPGTSTSFGAAITGVTLVSGTKYWLASLPLGGTLHGTYTGTSSAEDVGESTKTTYTKLETSTEWTVYTFGPAGMEGLGTEGGVPVVTKPATKVIAKSTTITPELSLSATNSPTSYASTGHPTGLTFNTSTGKYSGSSAAATGKYVTKVTATNGSGTSAEVEFEFEIVGKFALKKPVAQSTEKGVAATPVTVEHTAGGPGISPYKFKSTTLPTGLSIAESTGVISGTPTAAAAEYTVTIEAEDSQGSTDTTSFVWTVTAAAEGSPTITKPATQNSTEGTSIGTLVIVTTNVASISSTGLPAGLTLARITATESRVTGTPTTPGSGSVELKAKNGAGAEVTSSFTWNVTEPAATITKPATQVSTRGSAIATVKVKGTSMATLTPTALPAGLTLTKVSPTEWTITGTPTVTKALTSVSLEAKNAEGAGEAKSFNWTVEEATILEPAGTYKFKSVAGQTVRVLATVGNGEAFSAAFNSTTGYGTNDPNIAWILLNKASAFVEVWS